MWIVLSHQWLHKKKDSGHIPDTTNDNHQKAVFMEGKNTAKYLYDTFTNPHIKRPMPLVTTQAYAQV